MLWYPPQTVLAGAMTLLSVPHDPAERRVVVVPADDEGMRARPIRAGVRFVVSDDEVARAVDLNVGRVERTRSGRIPFVAPRPFTI
jgi:hypothetical protein